MTELLIFYIQVLQLPQFVRSKELFPPFFLLYLVLPEGVGIGRDITLINGPSGSTR